MESATALGYFWVRSLSLPSFSSEYYNFSTTEKMWKLLRGRSGKTEKRILYGINIETKTVFILNECSVLAGEVKILKNCVFSPLLHERFRSGLQIVLPPVRYFGTNLWLHCFFQRENLKPVSRDIKHHTLHSLTLNHFPRLNPQWKTFIMKIIIHKY